jgi:hypothetical protein
MAFPHNHDFNFSIDKVLLAATVSSALSLWAKEVVLKTTSGPFLLSIGSILKYGLHFADLTVDLYNKKCLYDQNGLKAQGFKIMGYSLLNASIMGGASLAGTFLSHGINQMTTHTAISAFKSAFEASLATCVPNMLYMSVAACALELALVGVSKLSKSVKDINPQKLGWIEIDITFTEVQLYSI